jgi:hypothetical protein
MPSLALGIHDLSGKDVDGRNKSGYDQMEKETEQ